MPIRGDDGPKLVRAVSHVLEPPSERRHPSGTISRVRLGSTTVLVADDHRDTRDAIRELLVAEGYGVIETSDGAETLEILARAADGAAPMPDVLLLDFLMPGYSGLGVLRVLRRFERIPPAIIMTAFPDPSVEAFASNLGAARVLKKPIDADDLYDAVFEAAVQWRPAAQSRGA